MDQLRDLGGQRPLCLPRGRVLFSPLDERRDLVARLQREELQVAGDVAVIGVHPELVELVRRRQGRVEPDRPALRLAELRPRCRRDERRHETVCLAGLDATDQVDPRRDISPLVAAAHLDGACFLPVEVQEIVGLQQHVAELGVRNPRVEPRLDRLLLHHHVDGEVLADVAQEVDEGERHLLVRQPVGVVAHQRPDFLGVEVQEALHLIALPLEVLPDLLAGEQRALAALAAGIPDEAGAATHQHDRLVAGELEVPQQHQRHQVAELQAGRGRVEAAVHGAPPFGEVAPDVLCGVGDEPAPLQLGEEIGHGAES